MHPPLTMLVHSGQHSKWRVGVLNLLKQAIIKVYFPWYQRNSSEKQATRLWGILSIKYWRAAPAAMKSWKWINIYSTPSTIIGTYVKIPSSELSKGHKMTWKGSVALPCVGRKKRYKDKPAAPMFSCKKLAMSHYDISQHREGKSLSLHRVTGILGLSFLQTITWFPSPDVTLPRNCRKPRVTGRCMKDKWA